MSTTTRPRACTQVTDFEAGDGNITFGPVPQISFQGRAAWTFELWANFDALTDQMDLVSREGEFELKTRGDGLIAARRGQPVALATWGVLEHHRWYHIAVTFDGYTMTMYVNGRSRGAVTDPESGAAPTGKPLTLGAGFYGWSTGFRAWNTCVTPALIYRNQWAPYPPRTDRLVGQIDLTRWPPADTSGNNLPITVSTSGIGPVVLTPAASLGGSVSFCDPYNDNAVNPGGAGTDFSILAWVKPAGFDTPQVIFSNGTAGNAGMRLALTTAGTVSVQVGDGATVTSASHIPAGRWTPIAGTWTAASKTVRIYLNGLDATGTSDTTLRLPGGEPLIGGITDPTIGPLPSQNFYGAIQSVDVWNRVLTAEEIQRYQTDDPTTEASCIAAWSLTPPTPLNTVTRNPIGIVGDATIREIATAGTTGESRESTGMWDALEPVDELVPTGALPDPETFAEWVVEFREFVADDLHLDPADQAELTDRLRRNLDEVTAQLADGTFRVAFDLATERLPDGRTRVTLHACRESTVIYEGELSECDTWTIGMLIAVGSVVYQVFGFYTNLSKVAAGLTNYLGMSLRTPGLIAGLKTAFGAGASPPAIYKALKLLWDLGLLIPLFKVLGGAVTASLTMWTVLSLAGRLLLLLGPSAPLEIALFVTELGLAAVNIYNQWNKQPAGGCWHTTAAAAPLYR